MKKILLLLSTFWILGSSNAQNAGLTQIVKGEIVDEQSGHFIAQASIVTENLDKNVHAIANEKGWFKLDKIPVGRQQFRISSAGYEDLVLYNIEITSSKEVVLEIKLKEKVKKLDEVVLRAGKSKNKAINETALISARQLSTDEAFRFSGTRNDPSRMAQNFAGVSGSNDGRNDIVIRGNSPAGVLWRMDGIDIPNPNHFSTLGATGGPVSMLNINLLKNSDFLTSAFPASYGNAIAGVFDIRMRNGNNEKHEFLGQMGFNGFEFGAEGPLNKKSKASYLVNYRYSMLAALQKIGLNFGTGSATPYYQDGSFKLHLPTKKSGTFSVFGLIGESHIRFLPEAQGEDNLYSSADGSERDRTSKSITAVVGASNQYFFNANTSGKAIVALSVLDSKYNEAIIETGKDPRKAFDQKHQQLKYTLGYTFNKKMSVRNQLTTGITADVNVLKLKKDYIKNGDSTLSTLSDNNDNAMLIRGFTNLSHRFSDKLTSNLGVYTQYFQLNEAYSIEPRWNIKYQFKPNQSFSFGAGLHSQLQPLEVYFYQSRNSANNIELTNKKLDFVKSWHGVLGYDINFSRQLRLKAEVYGQYIFNAAVEKNASSFSMLNTGADFGFPDKMNLVNNGKGYNYGVELTLEHFLNKGFYFLFTTSIFESKYQGSDKVWRNTAFNSNFVTNALAGKEFRINKKTTFGIDGKITYTGGQRYTVFDIPASQAAGFVIYQEDKAYAQQNDNYFRFDLKFSYVRNLKKVTQKWFIDLQNLTNKENMYLRTLNPKTGVMSQINQMGFFPNINYQITF
ncbi:MAG: TonB-dependent receptor [Ferruginibacter sp.]